jgi:PilZ domain
MPLETTPRELIAAGLDRRRVPRYSCSGQAQIECLPLSGVLLKGRLRDLGLGGCCIEGIEAASPFDLGARTEILVEVNSWFFRAMGHVRALRGRSGISVEFIHMSAGGSTMLADLIADLERLGGDRTRPQRFFEYSRRILQAHSDPGSHPNHNPAIARATVPPQAAAEASSADRHPWAGDLFPAATSLNVFI